VGHGPFPSLTDGGLFLDVVAAIAGLGNDDVRITIDATAIVDANCCNPGEQCKVPGQNPALVGVQGEASFPADAIKNGNLEFDIPTIAPPAQVRGAPDCPNAGWTENILDLHFTSVLIRVEHPPAPLS
jgi:hypothetical protein